MNEESTAKPEPSGGKPECPPTGPGSQKRVDAVFISWLRRPAGFWVTSALTLFILGVPAWLLADELRYSIITGDDFMYIADALDWPTAMANLFKPHNTHVVPLFRLWTAAVVAASGRLEAIPTAFRVASYIGLMVTMLAVFVLVAKETGRTALGLAAMAGLGISTIVQPAVTWYSAGQALWAGAGVVLALIAARAWSRHGGIGRLLLLASACLAAPAVWSGGLLAGPAATAYIVARNPSRFRAALVALAIVSVVAVVILVGLSHRQITENDQVWEHHKELWPRPVQAVLHTFQAIAETMVLANLGLDAVTTPYQSVVLVAALAGVWLWSRGGFRGLNPLEASGAVVVVGSYLLVYFFRGNFPYRSLRALGWYNAIPQVGAMIFAAGWWHSLRLVLPHALTRIEALTLFGFVGLLCILQVPRVERNLLLNAPPLYASEAKRLPIPELQRLRALYVKEELLGRQVRALARLTKAEVALTRLHAGPETLRRIYGRVLVPGIPAKQFASDAFSVMKLPPDDPSYPFEPRRIQRAIDGLIQPEAEPRPPWLNPDDPWPRP